MLGPKDVSSHKFQTLSPIFTNGSFSQELYDKSTKIMKFQKFTGLGVWGLETKFGPLGPTRCYLAISLEPYLQFSQRFILSRIIKFNPIKSSNYEKYLDLGVWGWNTSSGTLTLKRDVSNCKTLCTSWWAYVEIKEYLPNI